MPPLPSEQWVRGGIPRPLAALAVLVAPFFWSGAIRAVLGVSLPIALLLALPPCALFAVALRRAWWPRTAGEEPTAARWYWTGALVVCAIVSFALLYNRWFGGLPVIVDGDSGTHVAVRDAFVTVAPGSYFGFVSFYAITWWIERVVHSAFVSFGAAYYLAVIVWTLAPLCAAKAILWRGAAPARWRAAFVAVVVARLALLYWFELPLFHYHQAEGFFPPLFGTIPLAALWLADGYIRAPRLRVVMLAVGVVAYRFTYGLNLADLLLAFGALVLLDARALFARLPARLVCVLAALAAFAAGYSAYQRLQPLWALNGWIIAHDQKRALVAEWLLVAVQACALVVPAARRRMRGRGIVRWLRFPVVFGAVNAAALTWLLVVPRPEQYYVVKYGLHAQLLLVAAVVPLLAALVAGPVGDVATAPAAGRVRTLAVPALFVLALGGGVGLSVQAIAVHRPAFLERAFGRPPFHLLHPLADLGAWMRINRVLKKEHKQFGGYLTTYYPVMNFMNAAFGYPNGGIHFYYGRPAIEAPGYCDFWESGPQTSWLEGDFPQRNRRARWDADPQRTCVSYPRHWDPEHLRTLCWRCR